MFSQIHVIWGVLLDVLHVVLMDMLRAETLLDGLRWEYIAIAAGDHLVGIDPFIPRHVNRQRIIPQRFHLIRC